MEFKIVPANRVQVYLLFYKPKDDDPFLNRLVARFDGPYCHVEMAFSDKWGEQPWEREMWGSSIYQGESVFFKPKTYARDGYFSLPIDVTVAQMYKIKSFCKHQADTKVPFNKTAMYAAYVPFYQFVHTDETFCSKHVTAALQHGDVKQVEGLNASLMTPSKLYKLLTENPSAPNIIIHALPSKMMAKDARKKCTAKMLQDLVLVTSRC